MSNFSIGVDLGGTNLRIAAVSEHGDLMEKVTLGTRVALGKDRVIHDMCDAIRVLAVKYGDAGSLQGIGIGIPGIIDIKTGMLRESPNLPGWAESPVQARDRAASRNTGDSGKRCECCRAGRKMAGRGTKMLTTW